MPAKSLIILLCLLPSGIFLPADPAPSSFLVPVKYIAFHFQKPKTHQSTPKDASVIDTLQLKKSNWYSEVTKGIEESEYEIKQDEGISHYQSVNRRQNLRAFYTGNQFTLAPRDDSADKWNLALQLQGVYAGTNKLYAASNHPVIKQKGNTLQFNHNNNFITEYINSKEGVRQNFIIKKKPAAPSGTIQIQLSAGKDWYINKVHDKELHFAKKEGDELSKKITYNSLKVFDAANKELEARFTVNNKHTAFAIEVMNTQDAIYPITIDPISTTASSILEGTQANDVFGITVASAGDVNGDGYSDVLVGAPFYTNGQTNEGRAFLFYGSATGISLTAAWTSESNQANTMYAQAVSTAGDVNGDGYSDIIIGCRLFSNDQATEGRAFAYYGSATGLPASPSWITEGDFAGAEWGGSVACAGDVNGDGYSDVIVGAPRDYDGVQVDEGEAFVFYGSPAGLSAFANWSVEGNKSGAFFGGTMDGFVGNGVASAGDVNGDGYSDIIIAAPLYTDVASGEGRVYAYMGSATGLALTPAWMVESNQVNAVMGNSIACAGDVNGDGYSDVIIGSHLYDNGQTDEGRAFLYLGSATGLSLTPAWANEINVANSYYGCSVASAGDVNGDGYSDVIVGASNYTNGNSTEGGAFLYLGSAAGLSLTPAWTVEGNNNGYELGITVAPAGDINGDGYSDIIVGVEGYVNGSGNVGAAYLYNGSPSGLSSTFAWTQESDQANAFYGICLASAGDINGDGYSDVIVGAFNYDAGSTDEGKAFVYLGSATGLSTVASWTGEGNQIAAFYGVSVASAGDVNGDGYSDIIVGANLYDNDQTDEGRAFVYYGSTGGLSVTPNWTAESNQTGSSYARVVTSAGDVNGDGYADVAVTAASFDNPEVDEGKVFVYYGSATGLSLTANWTVESNQANSAFGVSASSAGDVNGDGYNDLIVGAANYDVTLTDEGAAFLYLGSPSGLSATPSWTGSGGQASASFGTWVACAGDVNGDGHSDIIVGAFRYDNGQTDEGAAFVFMGTSTAAGLQLMPGWMGESNLANSSYGTCVASAGDVNGDGYSDVIVGAPFYNSATTGGRAFLYYGSSAGLSLTANATIDGTQANSLMAFMVAGAGDVNGDGYSDVLIGVPRFDNGQTDEGKAYLYYGNAGAGQRNNLRLYNQDLVTPIQQVSVSPALFGAGLYAKSPIGRQKGKLVWETEKNGVAFSGNPITNSTSFLSQQPALTDLGLTGFELKNQVAKNYPGKATYIRTRVKYDLTTAITGQVYGPWRFPESFLRGNRDIGAIVLPISFVSFTAIKQNDNVLLTWITENETPGINYEVQYCIDGIHFQTINTIDGNNAGRNQYQWLHNNPRLDGKNYYRIRALENGKETFSVTRQVYFGKDILVNIYPNPAKSGSPLSIDVTNNPVTGMSFIELFSIDGKKEASWPIAPGSNTILINLPSVSAGPYILKLVNENKIVYAGHLAILKK
jgi:hypothetical protein